MDAFSQSGSLWNKVYQTGSRDRSSSRFYLRFQKLQPEIEENGVFYQTNPIGLIDRIRSPSAFVELAAHCLPAISNSVFVDHETDVRVPLESRRVGSHKPYDGSNPSTGAKITSCEYALCAGSPARARRKWVRTSRGAYQPVKPLLLLLRCVSEGLPSQGQPGA